MIRRFLVAVGILIVFVSCERDVFTGYEEIEEVENCKIFIESDPSKALIYLNGMNTGKKTPDTLSWLSSGENKITLKTDYFDDTTTTVNLSKNIKAKLYINFEANSRDLGKINCLSYPEGAEIFLDGASINQKTPFIIKKVHSGTHYLKYRYSSHRDDSISVKALGSTLVTAYLDLEDTSKWISYNTKNSPILSNTVNSIAVDHKNNIWIGTDNGLCRKSNNIWTCFTTTNTILPTNTINHVAVDNNDGVWLSTSKGIYLLKNSVVTDYSYNLANKNIKMIVCSKKNTIWAAATGIGLCKFVGDKWIIYNSLNSGLKDNNISCMALDKDEYIWIGSILRGITVFNGVTWNDYYTSGVYSLNISENNEVWAGTIRSPGYYGTVIFFDGEIWTQFSKPELMVNLTLAIYNSTGKVFLGTQNGLGILGLNKEFNFYKKGNLRLDPLRVQSLAVDLNGNLWVGTPYHGSGMLKKENF
ncbi:MAG: PEGA domain-containing protein [Ignavibacteriales bacterium]|nr:PEGA domain-containing protein [Ignavibacteriales bacterium]